ncbi:membrane-associated tyrosine- and threonine-specific cdc2-inhibitory kinase [Agrilus planipennis]|uniref:non-specific serine/threonine protein kinase n=1 Tax=Agrilus planipennis TaxID=224129 RepID=A0A1W4X8M2_AGRPL|nr:membrane-associated tyrosine- and threonine-specific cdc2-inhibitory kinase [Agrilus planipennis]
MAARKRIKGNLSLTEVSTRQKHLTKKELELRNTCSGPVCPPVPMKLRRSNGKELFNFHDYAVPVYFQKEIPLSAIYKKELKLTYMEQVFENQVKVGEGSFGNVYRARSKEDNEYYAIKVAKNNHTSYSEKFGEVLRLEKIEEHERCVKYFLAWEEQGHLYIQLELCMTSLDKYAQQNHYIPEQQMWDILIDILEALKHLHNRNLIHLDIKPENIMITSEGIYKLGDFGLLLDLNEFKNKKNHHSSVNVSEGDSKYLAAEVLQEIYTTASDVFSLGISMLELATDLMLPTNGPLWHQLRSGIYPKLFEESKYFTINILAM